MGKAFPTRKPDYSTVFRRNLEITPLVRDEEVVSSNLADPTIIPLPTNPGCREAFEVVLRRLREKNNPPTGRD